MKLRLIVLAALSGSVAVASQASAATYLFQGECTKGCTGEAIASLTVKNYAEGSALDPSNLVEFRFQSSLVSYDINGEADALTFGTIVDGLSGAITSIPGSYAVNVSRSILGLVGNTFSSDTTGAWNAAMPVILTPAALTTDIGIDGVWNGAGAVSSVPEPGTWILFAAATAAVGFALRRRGWVDAALVK